MKILYGVQTTGNGHLSRAKEMIPLLKSMGHDVQVLFSGQANQNLFQDIAIFNPHNVCKGFTFFTFEGKINYFKTIKSIDISRFYRDIRSYRSCRFDLVITDFEPISARIAKQNNIPSIGIGHQYAFLHRIPRIKTYNPFPYFILKNFAHPLFPIGLHWHHFNQPILPPIIPKYLTNKETISNKILVYLPVEDKNAVESILKTIQSYDFYIYGHSKVDLDIENLHYRQYSRANFLTDLSDCYGVICNAGFELPSEALYLGKKLLVKPLHGQMEQESNALAIAQLNIGIVTKTLHTNVILNWLNNAQNLSLVRYPNDSSEKIATWINKGNWHNLNPLLESAWEIRY
jgi:uncharacterized protein (TIGR00661 family)